MMGCRGCVSSVLVTCGFLIWFFSPAKKSGFARNYQSDRVSSRSFDREKASFTATARRPASRLSLGPRAKPPTHREPKQACFSLFFALAGLVFSLYLGSAWYDRMLTSHVTKKVRKHIAASTAKND